MIPINIENWSDYDWDRKVYYCSPSGGGAVGVVFVWLKRANFNNPSTSDFVVKPIQGTAAPTKFAERILKNVAGAKSPKSKSIPKIKPSGIGLLKTLKIYRDRESNPMTKNRWTEVWNHYYKAQTFLIQELQSGMAELGDRYREEGGLLSILNNHVLLQNIGKLFAADALIGNGDRLDKANMGNIMFKPDGTISAIDSTTVLSSFKSMVNDPTGLSRFNEELNKSTWVSSMLHSNGGVQVPSHFQRQQHIKSEVPVLAPSFRMKSILDVKNWWDMTFRGHLEHGLSQKARSEGNPPPEPLADAVWEAAFLQFKIGFDLGVSEIDRQLSGLNWLKLKIKYNDYIKRHGGDPNLDWGNFKIRRRYFKLVKKGLTKEQALTDIQSYVKWTPGL